jgi:hypothetical protein
MTPISQEIRIRIDKGAYIKLETFCTSKQTITRIKRQPRKWGKNIFGGFSFYTGLLSEYIKSSRNKTLKEHKIQLINGQMN